MFLGLVKNHSEEKCWQFYTQNIMSIEILKDDQVQKIYFRVKDKVCLFLTLHACL